jgi:hypothetical protein
VKQYLDNPRLIQLGVTELMVCHHGLLILEWKMKRSPDWSGQMNFLLCRHGYHSLVPLGKEPTIDMR